MSRTESRTMFDRPYERPATNPLLRGLATLARALAGFALTFIELLAEFLAPLLLLAGGVWWLALQLAGGLTLEPELQQYLHYLPRQLQVGGEWLTPGGLIRQGLLLMAVVAACRTLNRLIGREL